MPSPTASSPLPKPAVAEVHAFLRRRNTLLIHFSGCPKGVSSGVSHDYPDDLRHVLAGHAQGGLSCSVVTPTDIFHGFGDRNAFGCIGLILDLNTPDSLMAVGPHDLGSWVENGVRRFPPQAIAVADLEASLDQRVSHNEWGVRDFTVRGVMAAAPFDVWTSKDPGFDYPTNPAEVSAAFPGQPVYTIAGGATGA